MPKLILSKTPKAEKPKSSHMPKTEQKEKQWQTYEEVATYLLNRFAEDFGLGRVEGKQIVPAESGTKWEIDAKGCKDNDTSFVIVECKRYTTNKINQETVAGLAYRIKDTNASGAILVSPIGLQAGAKKIAEKENIIPVTLNQEATTVQYILAFLTNVCIGICEEVRVSTFVIFEVRDEDGNIIETRTST
ncbi:hypothetical protein FACS189441_7270 [Betaproteobacteria bacterium]|nr:hypothetical protein FACS189441_7270 [Betaproteobacteria bacterium]